MKTLLARLRAAAADQDGVTLVELIVYIVVASLLLALMAGVFAAGLGAEAATRDRDTATGRAQVVSQTLQTGIRGATDVRVEADGMTLRARVATGTSSAECRAWTLAGGVLYYETSGSAIAAGSTAGWTALASGVTGTLDGAVPFAASGSHVDYAFDVTVGEAVVPLTGGAGAQAKTEGTTASCW